MSNVETLTKTVRAMSRERFAAAHGGFFLIVYSEASAPIAFATRWESVNAQRSPASPPVEAFSIEKSTRNPYAGRISLGRASNCDLVLRHASVSKLHAHFRANSREGLELVDLGSKNGTKLNERALASNAPYPLSAGDVVHFGAVPARLVDAGALFDLLRA